jgi:hypothetical protein
MGDEKCFLFAESTGKLGKKIEARTEAGKLQNPRQELTNLVIAVELLCSRFLFHFW